MSIKVCEAPTRTSARAPRLCEEDIKDLADAVSAGQWVTDEEEPVPTRSAAWQRAQKAADLVRERFGIEARTTVRQILLTDPVSFPKKDRNKVIMDGDTPVMESHTKVFDWAIGPPKAPKRK